MNDNQSNRRNSEDSFEENLRQILSGDDEHPASHQKPAAQKPYRAQPQSLAETSAPERQQKYALLFTLIRAAAFVAMVGLLVLFVCRTMG